VPDAVRMPLARMVAEEALPFAVKAIHAADARVIALPAFRRACLRALVQWIYGKDDQEAYETRKQPGACDRQAILDLLKIDTDTPLDLSTDGHRLIVAPAAQSGRRQKFEAAQRTAHKRYGKAFKKLAEELYGGCPWSAAYVFHMCQNQAFVGGNKRTGANAAITFLLINDWEPDFSEDELVDLVLTVASGKMSESALTERWRHAAALHQTCSPVSPARSGLGCSGAVLSRHVLA